MLLSSLAELSLLTHASPPPEPLSRAHDALSGLFTYYSQTERGGQPAPPATDCPCFHCSDDTPCHNKTQCTVCSVRDDAHCDADPIACYTTAAKACNCNDPPKPWPPGANTAATYFFVCGQIGGTGPAGTTVQPDQCLCESDWPFGCTNCYRWWTAVAIEAMASYAIAKELKPPSQHAATAAAAATQPTEAEMILHAIESAWTHAPYNAYWNATEHGTWVDDFAWYGLAYMRAHDWTGGVEWLKRAADIHDWARTYGWDKRATAAGGECGGFWWNTNDDKRFKDSISMVEVLHLASRLAVAPALAPAERQRFLRSAEDTWAWLFAFDGGRGLLAPNGIMSTGAQPEWCCAADSAAVGDRDDGSARCSNSRVPGMSYNHGLLMSSAALLYNATGTASYLARAQQLLAAAAANLTNADGAVRDVQRGSRMNAPGLGSCSGQSGHDPGTDFFSFKGIFVAHLAYFAEALGPRLTGTMRAQLLSMVSNSSEHAWSRSATRPPFDASDHCNVSVPAAAAAAAAASVLNEPSPEVVGGGGGASDGPPKFRWWWSESSSALETPPDPRLWFVKADLRCQYTSALYRGQTDSAATCSAHCAATLGCVKWSFNNDWAHSGDEPNCWLFAPDNSSDRGTGPACGIALGFTSGVKRPANVETGASCATRCEGHDVAADPTDQAPLAASRQLGVKTETQTASVVEASLSSSTPLPSPPDVPACRCDAACARHLDCCLDFVEECAAPEEQLPSCAGRCYEGSAVPIPGGGYCWCEEGCDNTFTDNNSLGSCCADFTWRCEQGAADPLCLDARTQTQALHLFVAHHVLQELPQSQR